MDSVWSKTSNMSTFESLNKDIKTDVLIIGGGMVGILTAHMLKEAGIDYVIAEADRICSGITKNTTAKITSQHGLIYNKTTKSYGEKKAKMYLDSNQEAISKYEKLCKNIDCDFEKKDAYVYSINNKKIILDEIEALKNIGFNAELESKIPLPINIKAAIKFKNQAEFNPLKFVSEISKNLNIYEKTKVTELIGYKVKTQNGSINAKKIIVATHFPFINKHGYYFIKMFQHRSYVIAIEDAKNINGMYIDEAEKGLSFRNYKGLLLIGGGDHKTGKDGGKWQELIDFAKKHYPNSNIKYKWATQDCMTLDGLPYIGLYSKNVKDFYVATGFNKWGMTSSMLAAEILCDMIKGKKNPYAEVFDPSRSILQPQLIANAFSSMGGYLTPTTKRCPHMGCGLKWNETESSWDCPCHGSRFTKTGKLIDNPATGDLKQ